MHSTEGIHTMQATYKQKTTNRLILVIPGDLRVALNDYTAKSGNRQSEVIRQALIDYLTKQGYTLESVARLPMGGKRDKQATVQPIAATNSAEVE